MATAPITLDSIRAAAEAKYGALEIELDANTTVRMVNPLRLPKARRDELTALQSSANEGGDTDTILIESVRLVAETPAQANKLLKAVGDDLAVLAEIFERYAAGAQLGEASASQS